MQDNSAKNLSRAVRVPQSRAARLSRLGAMAAGVAGNMAANGLAQLAKGQRPNARNLILTPANIRRVTDELSRMRGAAMKIGQLMSMDTGDVLPPELTQILSRLRADADFMPPKQLRTVLNENWGPDWLRAFKSFDVRPIAAASIGQVHRAVLKDGRVLAIKVQYPGVARSIDSDVANVGALIRLAGLLPPHFDIAPYLDEARRQLREEADYLQEATYLQAFREKLFGENRFALPDVIEDFTTKSVLAMSFVDGLPIEQAADAPQAVRDELATRLIELTLRELFEFGLMQTDPNFANYRVDLDGGRIALLDFGASRRFDPGIASQYRALMAAGMAGDTTALEAVTRQIGFLDDRMDPDHRSQIIAMIGSVFAHIRAAEVFDFATSPLLSDLNAAGQRLAEQDPVPPELPMDALYLQRKFAGMFLLATRLGARVPLREIISRYAGPCHRINGALDLEQPSKIRHAETHAREPRHMPGENLV